VAVVQVVCIQARVACLEHQPMSILGEGVAAQLNLLGQPLVEQVVQVS
jgi:hypothetical protein